MARISDVVSSSRETSPDPITLPSSPLVAHSERKPRSSVKPSPRKMNRRSATPSKSVVLDTPAAGNESPWRIKVTVEAEPRDGSPGKRRTRTTSVPLNDSPSKRGSSPSKRVLAQKANGDVKRPARKRKGTPLRDTRPARPQPEPEPTTEEGDAMPQRSHSPARRASGRLARMSAQPGSARSKRLSYARDELDWALQNAVGYCDVNAPGDMTTSKNEDFSMVSMESLQTAKENSMSNVMQTIPEGDNSAQTVSYMASSPPKPRYPNIQHKAERARSSLGKSVLNAYDPPDRTRSSFEKSVSNGYGPTERTRSSLGKSASNGYDPMSWKPTGPAKKSSPRSTRKQQEQHMDYERQWQRERESVSQQVESAEDVITVDDVQDDVQEDQEQQMADADEDIWQDEASRSLEDQRQDSYRSRQGAAANQPERSPRVGDLFADQPLKPLRSKIPRTWRRSSGMDFSYVDSPAHEPPQEPEPEPEPEEEPGEEDEEEPYPDLEEDAEDYDEEEPEPEHPQVQIPDRRHSTDGSGVLTPPSTEDSEGSDQEAGEDPDFEESEFEPDAEATRVQNMAEEDGAGTPGSDDSDSSPDRDDTGNFFQTNLPQVYMQERPRRRPPRQKTMDLTELLNLDEANSPAKAAVTGSKAGAGGSPKVHQASSSSQTKRSPLQMRAVTGRIDSSSNEPGSSKVISSPLRRSLLRSSKMHDGGAPTTGRQGMHMRFPPEMQRLDSPHSQSRSVDMQDAEPGDSFESKASDQRQLLSEAAIEYEEQQNAQDDQDNGYDDEQMDEDVAARNDYQAYAESEEYYEEDQDQEMDVEEEEKYYEEEDDVADPSRSYEERLNLDSPQKVPVHFNDSRTASSLLANNRKHYPPLFDLPNAPRHPQQQSTQCLDSSSTITLISKKQPPVEPTKPSFLTRLSTTFWNTVIGTPSPSPPTPSECQTCFSPSLRTQIRNRYGVVSEEFPWTFAHMRTLHRMLNSLTSNRVDSIIPHEGPLPLYLEGLIDTYQTDVIGKDFLFTEAHAYVVLSFFQVVVSRHLIDAMRKGEVEPLGDDFAMELRDPEGSWRGDDVVFTRETHGDEVANWVNSWWGKIGVEFVVAALGTCVLHNQGLEEKWGMPFEELQRRGLVGKKDG